MMMIMVLRQRVLGNVELTLRWCFFAIIVNDGGGVPHITNIPHTKTNISQMSHISRQISKIPHSCRPLSDIQHRSRTWWFGEGCWAWKCKGFTSFAGSCQIYLSLALAVSCCQGFIHRDLGFCKILMSILTIMTDRGYLRFYWSPPSLWKIWWEFPKAL